MVSYRYMFIFHPFSTYSHAKYFLISLIIKTANEPKDPKNDLERNKVKASPFFSY